MRKQKFIIRGLSLIIVSILLSGCGKTKADSEIQAESTYFGDYAISVSGDELIYTRNTEWFLKETSSKESSLKVSSFPSLIPVETNYCAIYNDKLYYSDTDIGYENGEVKGGNCTIFCCNLDGKDKEEILKLQDASYLDAFIQGGMFYCIWETSGGESKAAVTELVSGKVTDIETGRAIRAVNEKGYYFEDKDQIYFCPYTDLEGTLFCEPEGEIISAYVNGDDLCVLSEHEESINLSVYNADGNCIRNFEELNINGEFHGESVRVVKADGHILYYELYGKNGMVNDDDNCNLVRYDLESGNKECCGSWYIP